MKEPCDWSGQDILKCIDNSIKALLAMEHRWKAKIDFYDYFDVSDHSN
jgi:hypothetical protein